MGMLRSDNVKEKHRVIGNGAMDEYQSENVLLCGTSELSDVCSEENNASNTESDHSGESSPNLDDSSGDTVEIQLLRQMWVHDGENLLVLHEELGGDPSKISVRTQTGQETLILCLPILGNQTLNSSLKSLKFN